VSATYREPRHFSEAQEGTTRSIRLPGQRTSARKNVNDVVVVVVVSWLLTRPPLPTPPQPPPTTRLSVCGCGIWLCTVHRNSTFTTRFLDSREFRYYYYIIRRDSIAFGLARLLIEKLMKKRPGWTFLFRLRTTVASFFRRAGSFYGRVVFPGIA
jgi:hypothetical protein